MFLRNRLTKVLQTLLILCGISASVAHAQTGYSGAKIIYCLAHNCAGNLILVAAHRGTLSLAFPTSIPENSLASIAATTAEMVELDVFDSLPDPNILDGPGWEKATPYLMHDQNTFRTVQGGYRGENTNYANTLKNKALIANTVTAAILKHPPYLCGGRGKILIRNPQVPGNGTFEKCDVSGLQNIPTLYDVFTFLGTAGAKTWGGVIVLDIRDLLTFKTSLLLYYDMVGDPNLDLANHVVFKIYPTNNGELGQDPSGYKGTADAVADVHNYTLSTAPLNLMLVYQSNSAIQKDLHDPQWAVHSFQTFSNNASKIPGLNLLSPLVGVKALSTDIHAEFLSGSSDPLFALSEAGTLTTKPNSFNVPGIYSPTLECNDGNDSLAKPYNGYWNDNGRCDRLPSVTQPKSKPGLGYESNNKKDNRTDWNNLLALGVRFIIVDDPDTLLNYLDDHNKRNQVPISAP